MSASADWLERLSRATEYRELEAIFSEIAASARVATDGEQLAASIDEAIRRLEQERLRDEKELEAFETQYASFKEQQKGVVGWFKRHLPLTETRRQEVEHRDTIADQRAEILADNLIIARAQMVKERILPPESRRLGHQPHHWGERLRSNHTVAQLAQYATVVQALTNELARSGAFVEQLSADIEAFAGADFSSKEDRQRKDADLTAARGELAELRAEIREEESMRTTAVGRLGQLVEDELSQTDPAFRGLRERVELLQVASQQSKDTLAAASDLKEALSHLAELEKRRYALPSERDQLEQTLRQLRQEADQTLRTSTELASELERRAQQYHEEVRGVEQAKTAVEAAKRLHDAYLQEQQGNAEVESADGAGSQSPVEAEYLRLQEDLQRAQDRLRGVAAPYETAKSRSDDAKRAEESLEKQLDATRQKLELLAQQEKSLRHDISVAYDYAQPLLERLKSMAHRYQDALRTLSWHRPLGSLDALHIPHSESDAVAHTSWTTGPPRSRLPDGPDTESLRLLERFLETLWENSRQLDRDLSDSQESCTQSWTRRCHELLDEYLAREVCSQSR